MVSVSVSGSRGKVTLWIPMIQRLGEAYKFKRKRLPIKTGGNLTLVAIINCWCIAEMKNKHTDTLNYPPDIAKIQQINTTTQSSSSGVQTLAPGMPRLKYQKTGLAYFSTHNFELYTTCRDGI